MVRSRLWSWGQGLSREEAACLTRARRRATLWLEQMSKSAQSFGGLWTEQKLDCLRKYLHAYTTIFKSNRKAQFFTTIYLDAFAGTGYRQVQQHSLPDEPFLLEEKAQLLKGSARIALEVEPGFDQYVFVEQDPSNVAELQRLRNEFPQKDVRIEQGDANQFIPSWVRQTDWETHRAVVFLDPYGMQVKWATIQSIAATRAIDLWLLFPAGIAVNRVLPRDKPPSDESARRITELFGSEEWRDQFYASRTELTLFGEEEVTRREADVGTIVSLFIRRLEAAFAQSKGGVLKKLMVLRNSRRSPMYYLCFACANPKGKSTALKIAGDLVTKYAFAEYLDVESNG